MEPAEPGVRPLFRLIVRGPLVGGILLDVAGFAAPFTALRVARAFLVQAALVPPPEPITDPNQLARLNIHRRDRLGGLLHEYEHAA